MLPYWILFALFAVGALRGAGRPRDVGRMTTGLAVALCAVALMIGLRFEVGGDWYAYLDLVRHSRYIGLGTALARGDPGYMILNWVVAKAGFGLWLVDLVCAAVFVWGLGLLVRLQPNPWLAVLVAVPYMIIVVAMGYTRQSVALGLLMAALASFHARSMPRFTMLVVAAVTFHRTAIVFLPFGLLSVSRNRFVVAVLSIATMVALYYAFVVQAADRLVRDYVTHAYSSEGAAVRIAMSVPPAMLFLAFRRRFNFSKDVGRLYANMALAVIGAVAALMASDASTAVDRLALYLLPLQIVIVSRLPTVFARDRPGVITITALIVVYLAVAEFVWLNYANNAESWLPYKLYGFG